MFFTLHQKIEYVLYIDDRESVGGTGSCCLQPLVISVLNLGGSQNERGKKIKVKVMSRENSATTCKFLISKRSICK